MRAAVLPRDWKENGGCQFVAEGVTTSLERHAGGIRVVMARSDSETLRRIGVTLHGKKGK